MNCRKFEKLLLADDELHAADESALAEHLSRCPDCRVFQAQVATFTQEFESLLPVSKPRYGFAGRVVARIPVEPTSPPHWRRSLVEFLQPVPAACAVASLAMGIFLADRLTAAQSEPIPRDLQAMLFLEFFAVESLSAPAQTSFSIPEEQGGQP